MHCALCCVLSVQCAEFSMCEVHCAVCVEIVMCSVLLDEERVASVPRGGTKTPHLLMLLRMKTTMMMMFVMERMMMMTVMKIRQEI